jgi:clan AA aspartic protease (TIGR02281 family)
MNALQRSSRGFYCVLLITAVLTIESVRVYEANAESDVSVSRNQEQFRIYADADAPGFDYYQADPPSLRYCQSRCAEDAKCRAFTYNTAKKVCFLKYKASFPLKFKAGAITGRKSRAKKFIIRKNRDAPGNDYDRLDPPSLISCQSLCSAALECKAFTYNVAKKVCFLKYKGDMPLVPFKEAVAGIKVSQTPSTGVAGVTEVPLVNYGGTFKVPVLINDVMVLHFTVDSGASSVVLPADVARTLLRTGTLDDSDLGSKDTCTLADGSETRCDNVRIRKLKVGGHVVQNVDGVVVGSEGDLLLGQSFLRRFKSWSIDNNRQVLILE